MKLSLINNNMKERSLLYVTVLTLFLSACVPQRKFQELNDQYKACQVSRDSLQMSVDTLSQKNTDFRLRNDQIERDFFRLKTELEETEALYAKVRTSYEQLESNYKRIIDASSSSQAELMTLLKDLEKKLQQKEEELDKKEALLNRNMAAIEKLAADLKIIEKELQQREIKVKELQRLLSQKDSATDRLKKILTESLMPYKTLGLAVHEESGKVYVSLEESLLFQSGRTDVDKAGREALLKLCETLQKEKDFDIMVEGHTDNLPIKTAKFEDNWDLSVLRATSVLRIMVLEGKIEPTRIIPAGRGEYQPVDGADTKEARSKNRRIEIILSPDLAAVMNIIAK
jgi:chemotaxis protein MotB